MQTKNILNGNAGIATATGTRRYEARCISCPARLVGTAPYEDAHGFRRRHERSQTPGATPVAVNGRIERRLSLENHLVQVTPVA